MSLKPYKKGTRIMTNKEYMEHFLGKRCQHDHEHERIEGKIWLGGHWVNRLECSQVYPK